MAKRPRYSELRKRPNQPSQPAVGAAGPDSVVSSASTTATTASPAAYTADIPPEVLPLVDAVMDLTMPDTNTAAAQIDPDSPEAHALLASDSSTQLMRAKFAGMNDRQAARAAGVEANKIQNCRRRRLKAFERLRNAMIKTGVNDRYLIEHVLKPALTATETKFFKSWDQETRQNVIDERVVEDWEARLRALDISLNVLGGYAPKEQHAVLDGEAGINVRVSLIS